jgi:hypothetical protein
MERFDSSSKTETTGYSCPDWSFRIQILVAALNGGTSTDPHSSTSPKPSLVKELLELRPTDFVGSPQS